MGSEFSTVLQTFNHWWIAKGSVVHKGNVMHIQPSLVLCLLDVLSCRHRSV